VPFHPALLRAVEALLAHRDREAPMTALSENDRSLCSLIVLVWDCPALFESE
jgi:hypothetical protein